MDSRTVLEVLGVWRNHDKSQCKKGTGKPPPLFEFHLGVAKTRTSLAVFEARARAEIREEISVALRSWSLSRRLQNG